MFCKNQAKSRQDLRRYILFSMTKLLPLNDLDTLIFNPTRFLFMQFIVLNIIYLYRVINNETTPDFQNCDFKLPMKIKLLVVGKTASPWLIEGIDVYVKRLIHYTDFTFEVIPDIKNAGNMQQEQLKDLEATAVLKKVQPRDLVILLDEGGKQFSSEQMADQLQKWMSAGSSNVVFVVGGAFGFGKELLSAAKFRISLSAMTFSHQMVRLIFVEQLYRAFTILKKEPYHHR